MASNISHSLKVRLLNLSNHDNARYQQLIVRYMHERFLYRLSISAYRKNFILKGGSLLYAYEGLLSRPTLDVDFLGYQINRDNSAIMAAFKEIAAIHVPYDGVIFESGAITSVPIARDRKYPGIRISMTCHLDTIRKTLVFDVAFGDVITPKPVSMEYPTLITTMDRPVVMAYSLETVVAEKLQTMVEKSIFNSRMKDFFDLFRIISEHKFDEDVLLQAIKITFENRRTVILADELIFSPIYANDKNLESRWNAYCKKLKIADQPTFKEAIEVITAFIKPYWEALTAHKRT